MTPEERNAIREWLAGDAPKPPVFLRHGKVIVTLEIPKEQLCWSVAHGGTYLRDAPNGMVVVEVPR